MKRQGRLLWVVGAGLALLCMVVLGDLLFRGDGLIASHRAGDFARNFFFMKQFAVAELQAGNIPLWNPHTFSGTPFVGAMQSAVFYPPNALYFLLPMSLAANAEFLVHLLLLGLFVFLWLWGWSLHPAAAFFAAAVVAFGGPFFLRVLAGQLTVLGTCTWFPLLLLCIDRLDERTSLGWSLLAVATVTLMILAGHPPTAFMAAVAAGLYCVPKLAKSRRRGAFLLSLLPVAVAPLFLSAIQLWTGLAAAGQGIRAGGIPYEFATSFSFPPENLLTIVAPHAFGDADLSLDSYFGRWFFWDTSAYMGIAGLAFAVYGACWGRTELRRTSLLAAVLLAVLAFGRYTPLYALVHAAVPGFDQFRAPSKFMFFAALFGGALAAIGADQLLARPARSRAAAGFAALLAAALGALALWVWLAPPGTQATSLVAWLASRDEMREISTQMQLRWNEVMLASLLAAAGGLLVVGALLAVGGRRGWGIWLVLALGVAELACFARANRGGTLPDVERFRRPNLAETYERAGGDRVLLAAMGSNLAVLERGYDLWGYSPMVLDRTLRFMALTQGYEVEALNNVHGSRLRRFHPLHRMLRGRYRVSWLGAVEEQGEPLPRFLFAREYRVVEDPEAILASLADPAFDPRGPVLLEEPPDPVPAATGAAGRVQLLDESTDHLSLEVELEQPAILLITDAYAPGWRARPLAGAGPQAYRVVPVNYLLRGIPLAAGHHRLRVEYSPLAYRAGAWASAVSGVLFLLVCARWLAARRHG